MMALAGGDLSVTTVAGPWARVLAPRHGVDQDGRGLIAPGLVRRTLELSCEAPLCSASSASTPCSLASFFHPHSFGLTQATYAWPSVVMITPLAVPTGSVHLWTRTALATCRSLREAVASLKSEAAQPQQWSPPFIGVNNASLESEAPEPLA